jgi:hypothetical protein
LRERAQNGYDVVTLPDAPGTVVWATAELGRRLWGVQQLLAVVDVFKNWSLQMKLQETSGNFKKLQKTSKQTSNSFPKTSKNFSWGSKYFKKLIGDCCNAPILLF